MTSVERRDDESVALLRERRARLERHAVALFAVSAGTFALICGAVIVSGWFAGVMDDRFERIFWLGSILGFVGVVVLAGAAAPGGERDASTIRRVLRLSRIGLILFVVAPVLCLSALVADFYL